MRRFIVILSAAWIAFLGMNPIEAQAHGGGLNAEGCHNNRKTGDYHCHRAPSSSVSQSAPQSGTVPYLEKQAPVPTCYTGPRGGTYTITPSGRKNYRGC